MDVRKWFVTSILLKIADIGSTLYLVNKLGVDVESNPAMHQMMQAYGTVPGLLVGGFIFVLLMWLLYIFKRKGLLVLSSGIMFVIVLINTLGIFDYIRG